ncbi:MAG: DUF5618 family protein [Bacteroidota bacterium]|nr:DUF5618 family protein [Bacteroidota bacterium]
MKAKSMDPIIESKRYIQNAKDILSEKAHKEDGYYQDKKYIKMAGHTAYSGVLVALDAFLQTKKKGRKSIEWYKEELSNVDRKILNYLDDVYEHLHLVMGYDGHGSVKNAQIGFDSAEKIINWVENRLN